MIQRIFERVARLLRLMAGALGITYDEANVIVYYTVIPEVYASLLDFVLGCHWVKVGYAALLLAGFLAKGRGSFRVFSKWVFNASVGFLESWGWLGMDYVRASVVFCVLIPVGVLVGLLLLVRVA